MKKIISFFVVCVLMLNIGNSYAGLKIISKEEMQKQTEKGEEIKNRKLYHTFEGIYVPNSKDEILLKKINKILIKVNSKSPQKLRKLYKTIEKKLEKLGKKYRDASGKGVDKKGTRIYFLLEEINNQITDFEGNQDLGCAQNIANAHMEYGKCVSNIRMIENDSGTGNQSYDYIFNHKWTNIFMTHCNDGYTKEESMYNGSPMVLCVDAETGVINDLINSGDLGNEDDTN